MKNIATMPNLPPPQPVSSSAAALAALPSSTPINSSTLTSTVQPNLNTFESSIDEMMQAVAKGAKNSKVCFKTLCVVLLCLICLRIYFGRLNELRILRQLLLRLVIWRLPTWAKWTKCLNACLQMWIVPQQRPIWTPMIRYKQFDFFCFYNVPTNGRENFSIPRWRTIK